MGRDTMSDVKPSPSFTARPIKQLRDNVAAMSMDLLAVEEPLEIRIGKEAVAVTMRTPGGAGGAGGPGTDADLAAGFCVTEGVVQHSDEIESIEPCKLADYGNVVIVTLTEDAAVRRMERVAACKRELYVNSSCGLCGKQSIDKLKQVTPTIRGQFTVSPSILAQLPQKMRTAQATFEATGGLHAAAVFTPTGELRFLREDVGRHNAVDKVIGAALLAGQVPLDPAVLLVSGRASFEIVQKAAMAGVAVIAAVSAPSSLAVDTAEALGITLIGFLREGRMNVYCDRARVG